MIDNYDSFTYNIVQYLQEFGVEVRVIRNDELGLDDIERLSPRRIVISPGPGTPDQAGISLGVVQRFAGRVPILGVCLGHQAIAQSLGAEIVRARRVMHGKTSMIHHDADPRGVLRDIESPFEATRYHSLVVAPRSLPETLEMSAWTNDEMGKPDEIMALTHRDLPLYGVQFHPESIFTQHGHHMLANFLED